MEILLKFNLLSANPIKCSNTLKQFVSNLLTNCLSVFDHFVILALKGLKKISFSLKRSISTIKLTYLFLNFIETKLYLRRYPQIYDVVFGKSG